MKPTAIFANATSRLHADLIVIRLKHAGIPCEQLSAIYPEELTPNCALCWLQGKSAPTSYANETVVIAGPMRKVLSVKSEDAFKHSLEKLGTPADHVASYAEHLSQGEIVIGVNTANEDELAIVWHTLCELRAESISVAETKKSVSSGKKWFSSSNEKSNGGAQPSWLESLAVAY